MRSLVCLLLLTLVLPAGADTEARTYTLENRPAGDIANQLRELYSADEIAITAQGQQMIIRAEYDVLREIDSLIDTMDVAPLQIRVSVRSGSNMNSKSQGGGVTFSKDGKFSVGAERKVTTTRQNRERSLVMQDGVSAHITSGQVRTLPVALRGGFDPLIILEQIETRSGFVVTPRVISRQTVELTILSFEEDPARAIKGYETEAVMTIRRVEPGQWVELGSSRTSRAGNRSGITYRAGGNRQQNQTFEVKVNLL
jgi:hypothetical protein